MWFGRKNSAAEDIFLTNTLRPIIMVACFPSLERLTSLPSHEKNVSTDCPKRYVRLYDVLQIELAVVVFLPATKRSLLLISSS